MANDSKYIVFDVETGGLNPKDNPITEIALLVLDNKTLKELDRWETLVQNYGEKTYQPKALKITGISLSDVKQKGMEPDKVVETLDRLFKEYTPKGDRGSNKPTLVGHNVPFDLAFLCDLYQNSGKDLTKSVRSNSGSCTALDTLMLSKMKLEHQTKQSYKLEKCYETFVGSQFSAHRAMEDVIATSELFRKLMESYRGGEKEEKVTKKDRLNKRTMKESLEQETKFKF